MPRKKSIWMILKHDIYSGILSRWLLYFIVMLILLLVMLDLNQAVESVKEMGLIQPNISFLDGVMHLFLGIREYRPDQGFSFDIPVLWLFFHLYLAFMIGSYAWDDLHGIGQQIILKSKSRRMWWLSKCIWNFLSVLVYYLSGAVIIFLTLIIFIFMKNGHLAFWPSTDIGTFLHQLNLTGLSKAAVLREAVLLPILVSAAVCLLQMFVSLLIRPLYTFIITTILLISSAFFKNIFLIGNGSMMLRNAAFTDGGIDSRLLFLICLCIILLVIAGGSVFMNHYDILEKE